MNTATFLIFSIRTIFIFMMAISIGQYWRERSRTRLDIMLMFTFLGINVSIGIIDDFFTSSFLLPLISSLTLIIQPLLLVRLVQHFRWVPKWWFGFVLLGTIISGLLVLIFPTPRPLPIVALIVIFFVIVQIYATVAFIEDARTASGVLRYRLLLIASGSALLGIAIFCLAASLYWSAMQAQLITAVLYLGLLIGLSYFIGFSPPAPLLHIWQLFQIEQFIQELALKPIEQQSDEIPDTLCDMAMKSVGGTAAMLALWNPKEKLFTLQPHQAKSGPVETFSTQEKYAGEVWQSGRGKLVSMEAPDLDDMLLTLMIQAASTHCLIVPIQSDRYKWGLLLVFLLRDPLFVQSDLNLLNLLCRQSAATLDYATALITQKQLTQQNARLYHQVQNYAQTLERRVAKRTADLQQRNEDLDAFAHTVAHDLKNPLAMILGYTEYVRGELESIDLTEIDEHLGSVTLAAKKMNQIIDEILLLSSTRQENIPLQKIDMKDVVLEAKVRLQHMIEKHGAQLDLPDELPVAVGYAPWLEEIWTNYISNAIKYGGLPPQIRIGATTQNDKVRFWVEDNGNGIPAAEQNLLFKNFSRVSTSKQKEGHGLGLAIVSRIIHRLGGEAGVESVEGVGSRFYFTLPAA